MSKIKTTLAACALTLAAATLTTPATAQNVLQIPFTPWTTQCQLETINSDRDSKREFVCEYLCYNGNKIHKFVDDKDACRDTITVSPGPE